MFKFVILAACVFASAQAQLIAGGSFAAGPALGAPLLGRTTVNAPETTIVRQQYVVDQPEIRYRAVPTIVQTAPIVKTITPVVHSAPAFTYAAAPALTYAAAPAFAHGAFPAAGLTYAGLGVNTFGAPVFAQGSPAITLLKK